jgi:hypothetical protein
MNRKGASLVIPETIFGNLVNCYEENVAFSELRITYVEELSSALADLARIHRDAELMSFSRYLKHLRNKIYYYSIPNFIRKGTGLVIHITPNNVPLGFAYSFIWGLISGNSNIVKTPNHNEVQSRLFFEALNLLHENPKFTVLSQQNVFTNIHSSDSRFTEIIKACDAKVVWGSNSTVESMAFVQKSVYTRSITFPDRISVCAISLPAYCALSSNEKISLAKKFVRDFQSFNQLACSSPWIVYWIRSTFSGQSQEHTDEFWGYVNEELDSIPNLLTGLGALRVAKLAKISAQETGSIKSSRNLKHVTVLEVESVLMSEIDAGYGIFYQINCNNLEAILLQLNERVQTMTYFGMSLEELEDALKMSTSFVPKRTVPVGTALEFEWIWDGRDVMSELTEICQVL